MLAEHLIPFHLENYKIHTLVIDSKALSGNILGDPTLRYIPVLVPKAEGEFPLVLFLSGYAGDGVKNFAFKGFENNLVQDIDVWTSQGEAPKAIYAFANAWTAWGGSQFINSKGCGQYEDYLVSEVCAQLKRNLPISSDPSDWCVHGGSSGGYGVLSLMSRHGDVFKKGVAIAPDSFFEASLLPEIYKVVPVIEELGGTQKILSSYRSGDLKLSGGLFFQVFNVIAMAHCYASMNETSEPVFPIDHQGKLLAEVWQHWKSHDPIEFLPKSKSNLQSIEALYLSVGTKDEYGLQYGARQIKDLCQDQIKNFYYKEFQGTHRDLSKDRLDSLKWLKGLLV
ncbi:MAG: S9 family peptidase [Bdellovibrionaceae bacterium]|nr:S9 family peptidase [Pseudobdellovibrionaceae bacterium]